MNFASAVKFLNSAINKKQPTRFNDQWVKINLPGTYKYIRENIKTITGVIDWDLVISSLDRNLQKRWGGINQKMKTKRYSGKREFNKLIKKYHDKLYTFINPLDGHDKHCCDVISIYMVRLAQKGNTQAEKQIIFWTKYVIEEWMEKSPTINRWLGYSDLMGEEIKGCIRRYRYTGSFLGYLYRTLYYRGKGLRSLYAFSFDDNMPSGGSRKIDHFVGQSVFHLSHTR